jgi:polar amino acid transport system substrate-binding protein
MRCPTLPSLATAILVALLAGHPAAASAGTIKAVTEESSYTFMHKGRVAGPATEIVEATLKRAGLADHRFAMYPWARAYDMALREPDTLIYLIARTPAREAKFKWAGEFLRIEYHLYKLRSRTDVTVRSLADAKAYSVAVMRDDVRHQYLHARGFGKLVVSSRNIDTLRMLADGRAQLVPLPEADVPRFCREAGIEPAALEKVLTLDEMTTGIWMAYSLATSDDTVARTRKAFDQLKAEGLVTRLMAPRRDER